MADTGPTEDGQTRPQSATSHLKHVAFRIPTLYRDELVQLFKFVGPTIISQSMIFLIGFVSTVFCGHLGKIELASVALAIAVVNVFGIVIGTGLSMTLDTLISQTFGSGNLKRVGVILQQGVVILLLACFPCWAVLLNTELFLILAKQNRDVASLAQLYVNVFMPALPAAFMYALLGKYLQNQKIVWPQVITGVIGNVLNAIINYVFLYTLELGVAGSAAANLITQYSLAGILCLYIIAKGLHKETWAGWSMDCLQDWLTFLKLAIPSLLMLCLEFWVFELGSFLSGIISEVELGAQSVMYQLIAITFVIPLAFSSAASTHVGNALGANRIEQAKLSAKVPVICATVIGIVIGLLMIILKDYIGYVFTKEQEIIKRVSDVAVVYGVMFPVDALAYVSGGVLRGVGKQKIGAVCNLIGYYLIGLPIGVSLMFAVKMGIVGLGIGITICVAFQSAVYIFIIWKLDWREAAKEAQLRAGVQANDENEVEMTDLTSAPADVAVETPPAGSRGRLFVSRGLALFVMLVILILGILAKIYLLQLVN